MSFLVSLNRRVVGKNNAQAAAHNRDWEAPPPGGWPLMDLVDRVALDGFAWSWVFKDGERKQANFQTTNVLALDMEGKDGSGMLWEAAASDPFFKRYASWGYTTPSHTDGDPRFRVLFLLDGFTLDTAADLRAAQEALQLQAPGPCDRSTKDAARLWYGSPDAFVEFWPGKVDRATLDAWLEHARRVKPAQEDGRPDDDAGPERLAGWLARPLADGDGRHKTTISIAGALRRLGVRRAAALAILQIWNERNIDRVPEATLARDLDSVYGDYTPRPALSPLTDLGMAERFARANVDRFIYVGGAWAFWDNALWRLGADDEAAGTMLSEGVGTLQAEADRVREADADLAEKLDKYAIAFQNGSHYKTALGMAATFPEMRVDPAVLDAKTDLINVLNGTLVLGPDGTATLKPSDPKDYLTKTTATTYQAGATCPKWDAFLAMVQPDPEVRDFLQRLVGYALLGSNPDQVMAIFHGAEGANGKSTFTSTIQALFGDYAKRVSADVLLSRGDQSSTGENASPALANLQGARLVITSEIDAGKSLSEGLVKDITGGDPVTARKLYSDPVTFTPGWLTISYGNHKPRIKAGDSGIWRRLILVPFDVVIPKELRRDMAQVRAEFMAEGPGILNWALAGLASYFDKEGLRIPEALAAATKDYQDENDDLGRFLEDQVELGLGYSTPFKDLYTAYVNWVKEDDPASMGKYAWTRQRVSAALESRGFRRSKRGANVLHIDGLRLKFSSTPF